MICPNCNSPSDNVHDREHAPNAYGCSGCEVLEDPPTCLRCGSKGVLKTSRFSSGRWFVCCRSGCATDCYDTPWDALEAWRVGELLDEEDA